MLEQISTIERTPHTDVYDFIISYTQYTLVSKTCSVGLFVREKAYTIYKYIVLV